MAVLSPSKGRRWPLTIDSIYSRLPRMNIALTKHFEELIARLVASGRYNNSSEVVRAALRLDVAQLVRQLLAVDPSSMP